MKVYSLKRILAFGLAALMLLAVAGCGKSENSSGSGSGGKEASSPGQQGSADSLSEYIGENGKIDTSKLTPYKAAEVATVNGRNIIKHNGKPYLYNALHFRYKGLKSGLATPIAKKMFEEGMQKIKESGVDTVILYIYWEDMYDGKTYNFDNLKYQYDVAIKNDLKIQINWFGYDNCGYGGFRKWQKMRSKYPALEVDDPDITEEVPDLSKQIFIDEEIEAIQQLCAFINIYDKDRRTVAIQLENEPDLDEGGMGNWLSQFSVMVDLLNKLGEAVHNSSYSMITKINLTMSGWDEVWEGLDYPARVNKVIEQPHLDLVGPDLYDTNTTQAISFYNKGTNIPAHLELGPSVWSAIGQCVYHLVNGYGMGWYDLIDIGFSGHHGLYRLNPNKYEERDGTQILGTPYKGEIEGSTKEFIAMSNSVGALKELLASVPVSDMAGFNVKMKNVASDTKKLGDKKITYDYSNPSAKYGASGLVLKGPDGAYYCFSSQAADFTFTSAPSSVTYGSYNDGAWSEAGKAAANGAKVTLEPGKAYRVVL